MIAPRCLIGGVDIRRPFQGVFEAGENGFVDVVKSFRGCPDSETSSRDRDRQAGDESRGQLFRGVGDLMLQMAGLMVAPKLT